MTKSPAPHPSKQRVLEWLSNNPEITRRELCRRAGISESTLTQSFAPNRITGPFKADTIHRLAMSMGISPAELLGDTPVLSSGARETSPREASAVERRFGLLPHGALLPNPDNPRRHYEAEALAELADTIQQHGLIQPLAVRLLPDGSQAMIIAGHRRWQAIQILIERGDWPADQPVPVFFTQAENAAALATAMVENLQRVDLRPLEEAQALILLRDSRDPGQLSNAEIAALIRRTPEFVQQRIALVEKLCDHGRAALDAEEITIEQARILTQFLPAGQMVVLRALDQNDAELRKGGDAFRARAKHLVELARNGGVATRVSRIEEAPRDEALAYDHQPERSRDAGAEALRDATRDNTQFIPPAADDDDDLDGDITADAGGDAEADAATAAFEQQAGEQFSAASVQDFESRVDALEYAMREAAAHTPAFCERFTVFFTLSGFYPDNLGAGEQCRFLRHLLPDMAFDDDAGDPAPAMLAQPQPPSAEIWQRICAIDEADIMRAANAAIAGLISLPRQRSLPADVFDFWQRIASDLGVDWPSCLYIRLPGASAAANSDEAA